MDNLMFSVQLADVSTICCSHPQGKSEAKSVFHLEGGALGFPPPPKILRKISTYIPKI